MTISEERTQDLPRDLALIALGIKVGLFVVFTGYGVLHSRANGGGLRSVYTSAMFLIPLISRVLGNWALAVVLIWSLARNVLDKNAATQQLNTQTVKNVFAAVYGVLSCGYSFGLSVFYPRLISSMYASSNAGWARLVSSGIALLEMPTVVLIALAAFWIAIHVGRGDHTAMHPGVVSSSTTSSPRLAVTLLCAVFFASIQIWLTNFYAGFLQGLFALWSVEVIPLTLLWIVGPLVMGVLAALGAWFGVSCPVQVRPFRALAATLLVMVLNPVVFLLLALVWVLCAYGLSSSFSDISLFARTVAAALYFVLQVLLMFGVTHWFYRSLQAEDPNSGSGGVAWPSSS